MRPGHRALAPLIATGLLAGCAMSEAPAIGLDNPVVDGVEGGGRLVVDLVDGTSLEQARSATGLELEWVSERSADEALAVVTVADLDASLDSIRGLSLIEAAEPSLVYEASGLPSLRYPDDPLYGAQWNFDKVEAPVGWRVGGGRGVVVAVIDTGVAAVPDLEGTTLLEGASFVPGTSSAVDDNGHGTHVAGTIAQTTNNGLGVAGLAPNATILPLKALSGSGMGQSEWIASAIDEAVDQDADIINMSLGGSRSKVIEVAVSKAVAAGVIVVAAAGNSGREGVGWPARHPDVIGVSATGPTDELAFYSSWGEGVLLSAPGGDKNFEGGGVLQDTISRDSGDDGHAFTELQGTSMASPHVAGAAAVLLGAGATSPGQVRSLLGRSTVDLGEPGFDTKFGMGRIDVGAAVRSLTLMHHGLLFLLGILGAWGLTRLGDMPRRGRAILTSGVVAGGLFFLPLLPLPPLPFLATLSKPFLLWPQALGSSLAGFPLWLSAVLPVALTFVLGPTRTLGPVVAGVCLGMATHMGWAAATGSLSPWFMPGAIGSGWLAVNALLSVVCAMAIIGVQKTREREEASS